MPLSLIEQVRLNIGDLGTPPFLTDAQIQHFLDESGGNVLIASGRAALALAFFFATKADQTTGRMSVGFSNRANAYRQMAVDLGVGDLAIQPTPMFNGGLSRDAIAATREDTDLVQPAFTRDLHDDPGTTRNDGGEIFD